MRVRLRFAKLGKVRFTSHRDVARMWERALRRAALAVVYSAGFSPRPKLAFGLALPTGHESVAEYLDVELGAVVDPAALPDRLSPQLPTGLDVLAAGLVEPGQASLQESVASCSWRIEIPGLRPVDAGRLVDAALAAEHLVLTRQRKGRDATDDVRPGVLAAAVVGATQAGALLEAELGVHPRSLRPAELLAVLSPGPAPEECRVMRTAQWIWSDGARHEPLVAPADATSPPYVEAHGASRRDHPDARPCAPGAESRSPAERSHRDRRSVPTRVAGRTG